MTTDEQSKEGGGFGGLSLTTLTKVAAFQKSTKVLIAAAYVGGKALKRLIGKIID